MMNLAEALDKINAAKRVRWLCSDNNPNVEQRDAYRAAVTRSADPETPAPATPSLASQLGTAASAGLDAASAIAHGESPFVQSPEQNARETICRGCDRFDPRWNKCLECKCFLAIKTWLKAQSCPIGKW